jgi:hypothetical protein
VRAQARSSGKKLAHQPRVLDARRTLDTR